MKNIYSNLEAIGGEHKAGICKILAAPKHWLKDDPITDFATGRVMLPVELQPGKYWIEIDLIPETYIYNESSKESAAGDFFAISLTGTLNFFNYQLQQQLETLRRCELVLQLTDKNKRRKLTGNTQFAMQLRYSHLHKNEPAEQSIAISLQMEAETPAPFYNPDFTPEITYNLLQDLGGEFLAVE
jgi:hypothetical protein